MEQNREPANSKENNNRYSSRYLLSAFAGMCLFCWAAISVPMYLTWKLSPEDQYEHKLFQRAKDKADINKDGKLQRKELTDLLKAIGCDDIIPDNKPLGWVDGTYMRGLSHRTFTCPKVRKGLTMYICSPEEADHIDVHFGKSDLEKYVHQNG